MYIQVGGPNWEVPLGRRDSRGASLSGSNYNIPAPNNTFNTILTKFKLKGLDIVDLVALSGNKTLSLSFAFLEDIDVNEFNLYALIIQYVR